MTGFESSIYHPISIRLASRTIRIIKRIAQRKFKWKSKQFIPLHKKIDFNTTVTKI